MQIKLIDFSLDVIYVPCKNCRALSEGFLKWGFFHARCSRASCQKLGQIWVELGSLKHHTHPARPIGRKRGPCTRAFGTRVPCRYKRKGLPACERAKKITRRGGARLKFQEQRGGGGGACPGQECKWGCQKVRYRSAHRLIPPDWPRAASALECTKPPPPPRLKLKRASNAPSDWFLHGRVVFAQNEWDAGSSLQTVVFLHGAARAHTRFPSAKLLAHSSRRQRAYHIAKELCNLLGYELFLLSIKDFLRPSAQDATKSHF